MLVYYGILFVGTLIQPVLALTALVASFASRNRRHVVLGGVAAAGAEILAGPLTGAPSMPPAIVLSAGLTVCALGYFIRRELGVPSLFEKADAGTDAV